MVHVIFSRFWAFFLFFLGFGAAKEKSQCSSWAAKKYEHVRRVEVAPQIQNTGRIWNLSFLVVKYLLIWISLPHWCSESSYHGGHYQIATV